MAGRSPEAYHARFSNPNVRRDIQINPEKRTITKGEPPVVGDPNQKSNGERFARGYRAFSAGSAVVYAGLGVAVAPIFFLGAGWNVVETGISHKIVKNKERQRLEGQPAEGPNSNNANTAQGEVISLDEYRQQRDPRRTRRQRRPMLATRNSERALEPGQEVIPVRTRAS